MKIQTSEATDTQLNWMVAKAVGMCVLKGNGTVFWGNFATVTPSTSWAQGGPIIESEGITVGRQVHRTEWSAECFDGSGMDMTHLRFGPTPLIAAMRCYVASKLGDSVEVPDELC